MFGLPFRFSDCFFHFAGFVDFSSEWNEDDVSMGTALECAISAPSWTHDMASALPGILAENARTSGVAQGSDSRPAKRPRGRRHGQELRLSYPSQDRRSQLLPLNGAVSSEVASPGIEPGEEADEDVRERSAMRGQSLADAETVNRCTSLFTSLTERVSSVADRNGGNLVSARLNCTSRTPFMRELLQSVQVYSEMSVLALVPEVTLSLFIAVLQARVDSCRDVSAASRRPVADDLLQIELGLLAATTILSVLNSPDVPRSLLVQDTLDAVLLLLRNSCFNVVYPLCDPMYQCSWSRAEAEGESAIRPAGKKRPEPLINACCALYEALVQLIRRESGLVDAFIIQAASLALPSLGVDGVLSLQVAAGKLIEAIASSHADQDWALLDGLREQLSKLPANRRSLRVLKVDMGRKQVRLASAVLMQTLNVIGGRSGVQHGARTSSAPDDRRKYVMRLCFQFVDELLKRSVRDRDAEYRVALTTFVSDCLDLFALPEWPSADMLVQALGLRLVVMLKTGSERGSDISVQTRVQGLEMLGTIAARICHLHGSSALQENQFSAESIWSDQILRETVLLHRFTLLSYLQSRAPSDASAHFAQQFQSTLYVVDDADGFEAARKVRHADADQGELSSEDSLRLRHKALKAGSQALAATCQGLRSESSSSLKDATAAALFLSQHRSFSRQLRKVIDTIRECLHQPEPTLRSKSIKMLSLVVEAEPAVLRNVDSLIPAIESSCMDVSKSVREASLDLLSRSVAALSGASRAALSLGNPQHLTSGDGTVFFERVFPVVQKRLLDAATSVRKRAIIIMHGVLVDAMAQLSKDGSSRERRIILNGTVVRICCTIADRLEDRETTVREAAERTLRLALFGFDPSRIGDTITVSEEERAALTYASRLVEVFVTIGRIPRASPSQRNVVALVLHEAIVVKRRRLLAGIVTEVTALLCGTEARLADDDHEAAANESEKGRRDEVLTNLHEKRLACTSVLEAFANVSPGLVSPHCHTLSPNLKGVVDTRRRSRAEIWNLSKVLSILEVCVPVAGVSLGNVHEVIRDVDSIVCVCPLPSIALSAVRCLCALARCASDPELKALPADTARVFYDFLFQSSAELASADASSASKVVRNAKQALPRLGLLARYGDFPSDFVEDIFGILHQICRGMITEWIVVESDGTSHLMPRRCPSSSRNSFPLRNGVVRSLTYFLVRHRSFLPKATPLLVAALHQGGQLPDYEAQSTVLAGLQEMLVEEESRNVVAAEKIGKDQRQAKSGAKQDVVLAAEEDVEAGYLALCAQAIAPELERTARSENAEVRKAVVSVLGLLVRQGLVLPATIVPVMFGLLVDENANCRDNALLVINFLGDRYAPMLSSAALPGIRGMFQHAMLTRSGSSITNAFDFVAHSAIDMKTGYSLVSPAMIQISRDSRRSILSLIAKEFDPTSKRSLRTPSKDPAALEGAVVSNRDPSSALEENGQVLNVSGEADCRPIDDAKLVIIGVRTSFGHLAFYAYFLATLDYAAGASAGGSFTAGGGNSVADAKMKDAREDVDELCGVISRIVSNSGQQLLEATERVLGLGTDATTDFGEIAQHTVPICMLLLVKRYLKETRWFLKPGSRDEDDPDSDSVIPLPAFDLSKCSLSCKEIPANGDVWLGEMAVDDARAQLLCFQKLMQEDRIEEVAAKAGSRRKSAPSGRRRGVTPSRRVIGKRKRAPVGSLTNGANGAVSTRRRPVRITSGNSSMEQTVLDADSEEEDDEDDDATYIAT